MRDVRVLLVDDDAASRTALALALRGEGCVVEAAHDGFKALAAIHDFDPSVVLTDYKMPGMSGIELMRRLREDGSGAAVVLMTAFGEMSIAVEAMREGAVDCLAKPLTLDSVLPAIDRADRAARQEREGADLRGRIERRATFGNIIGNSPEIERVFRAVQHVAPSRATVLLTGESGTGKELVAAAIHESSPRASGPFVKVHCAALAPTLLESELFGHERGAYTGADRRRQGRFEAAHGGTLFLDEIGELPAQVQTKLLRVLQEHEFERVGGNQTLHVDLRIIAATNRNLRKMVAAGEFREDLFYRLDVVELEIPPLRARSRDIGPLAAHFANKFAVEYGRETCNISDAALSILNRYAWPGNVRELENAIEHATVFSLGHTIEPQHLPPELGGHEDRPSLPPIPGAALEDIERYAILKTLEATGGSTSKAARMLGVSVRMIQYRLQSYGATPSSSGRASTDPPSAAVTRRD